MRKVENYSFSVKNESNSDGNVEYIVVFQDFQNIIGVGETVGEAVKEAYGNLKAYFEYCDELGIEIPEPAKNNLFSEYSGKITLRIPKTLHREIAEYANQDGISLNYIINDAIRFYLNKISLKKVVENACQNIDACAGDLENQILIYSKAKYRSNNLSFSYNYLNRKEN